MGWKALKEKFEIGHNVQVTDRGVCIGSGYISDLAVVDPRTGKICESEAFSGFLSQYYPALKQASAETILALLAEPDTFGASITVYTWRGGDIIERQCEVVGYPNVTHDGRLMYNNKFSVDKAQVVAWAKDDAKLGIQCAQDAADDARRRLAEAEARRVACEVNLAKLEADHPTHLEPAMGSVA